MPALNIFGRSWLVATDDLPVPMMGLMMVHASWCAVVLFVYERAHQGLESHCPVGKVALTWLFGTFVCFFLCICLEGLILRHALKGTILQPAKRRHVATFLYLHFMVTIADVSFTILGTFLDYHIGKSCYVRNHVHTAIEVVIVGNYFIIACNFLGVALIFNVFAHLPSEEKWNRLFSFLAVCLCMSRSGKHAREKEGSLSHIATCFGEVFQGADLVPSDIAAGLVLLALQHRRILESEPLGHSAGEGGHIAEGGRQNENTHINGEFGNLLAEGAHYARWALASYGWLLYTWANPRGGLAMAFSCEGAQHCFPCTCRTDRFPRFFRGEPRATETLDKAALKTCAGIRAEDLYYVSFTNGIGEQPYFIARDVARRAIVLSVRGTMSVQDCITDSMYKPVLLNADAINMPHLSGAQLHCHAGVVTATNYILSDLNRHQILHKVFFGNNCKMDDSTLSKSAPYLVGETQTERESWTLVLCGHSLGAGVATVLALHLRRVFQNIRVWGIEPPGGLLSAELAASCREWTVSITHGCDIITRLSGPCLLKLRRDLVDALVRCKLNKFSLLMRMTCAPDSVEESDLLLEPGCEAHEATILRRDFEQFHVKQIDERPLMAAPLYPPGRLLHLRRKSSGKRSPTASIRDMYEARWISAQELMFQGLLVNETFFTDHFPDKVVAVLSELALMS